MTHDCIIIGAGPAGLSAAIYLGRAHQKTLVVYGGPRRTALAQHIQNFLGFEDITGPDLLARGKKQAERYGVEFQLATVKRVTRSADVFLVEANGGAFESKNVIVASGIDDIVPPIDNLFEFLGETFFHCFDCDGYHLTGKDVCIIGAGDSSARTALAVKQLYTEKIMLIAPPEKQVSKEYQKRLDEERIKLVMGEVAHLEGDEGKIERVVLKDGSKIECDRALSDLGYTRNDSFLSGLDLKRSETGYIKVDSHYESSVPGLFVVGPLNTGPDQVSVAVGEGALAAMHIIESKLKL